jgi:outer membrane protein TolC
MSAILAAVSVIALLGLGQRARGEELKLKECIELALASSAELAFLRNQRGAMALVVSERWRDYLPGFGLGYSYGYSTGKGLPDERLHTLSLEIKQPLFNGGRTGAGIKSSQADYQLNLIASERQEQEIILEVKRSYFKVMAAKGSLRLSREMYDYGRLILETSRKELGLGAITRVELLTVESGFNEAELGLKRSESELKIALLELKGVLGIDSRREIDVRGDFDELSGEELEPDVERYVSLALRYRPEVRELGARLAKDQAELDAVESYFLPQVSLSGGYSISGQGLPLRESGFSVGLEVGFSFSNNQVSSSLGGGLDQGSRRYISQDVVLNPFGSGRNQIESLAARARVERTARDRDLLRQRVVTEVRSAYYQAEEASIRRRMALKKIEIVKEQLKIKELQQRLGAALRSEVFEVQTRLTRANDEYIQAVGSYFLALAQLERAVGVELAFVK